METDADKILNWISEQVKSGKAKDLMNTEEWLRASLSLNTLLLDETKFLEHQRREVAMKRLAILKGQEKRNVASAEAEIQASPEYEQMRNQEHKVEIIKEMIRLSKKSVDTNSF